MKQKNKQKPADEKIYDIDEYRKKRKRKKRLERLGLLTGFLLICGLAVGFVYFYQTYDFEHLLQSVASKPTQTPGGVSSTSFPISLSGMSPIGLLEVDRDLSLLTREDGIIVDSAGKTLHSFTHQFTNPVQKAGTGSVLTYDRGGYSYRVDSRSGEQVSGRMTGAILSGQMGKNHYALITQEQNYAGSITVFDKSNNEVLKWYSASEQIIDAAFFPGDAMLAIACVGFGDSALDTAVYLIDLKKQEEQEKILFSDALPIALSCKEDGSVHLVCDTFAVVIDADRKSYHRTEYPRQLGYYCFTGTETYLLTADNNLLSYTLTKLSAEAESLSKSFNGQVLDLLAADGRLLVLTQNQITELDASFQPVGNYPVGNDVFQIGAADGGLYLLSSNSFSRCETPEE